MHIVYEHTYTIHLTSHLRPAWNIKLSSTKSYYLHYLVRSMASSKLIIYYTYIKFPGLIQEECFLFPHHNYNLSKIETSLTTNFLWYTLPWHWDNIYDSSRVVRWRQTTVGSLTQNTQRTVTRPSSHCIYTLRTQWPR